MKVNKWFESKNILISEKKFRYINRENGGFNELMNESEYDVFKLFCIGLIMFKY